MNHNYPKSSLVITIAFIVRPAINVILENAFLFENLDLISDRLRFHNLHLTILMSNFHPYSMKIMSKPSNVLKSF